MRTTPAILSLAGALLTAPLATAGARQTAPAPAPVPASAPATAVAPDTAILTVYNRRVVVFRAPFGARSPADRALAAAGRIRALLAAGSTGAIEVRAIPEGRLVLVDGTPAFSVTPADADGLSPEALDVLTADAVSRLQEALDAANEEQGLVRYLWSAMLVVIATIAFLVVLRVLRWGRRRLHAGMNPAAAPPLRGIAVRGFTVVSADRALALLGRLVDLVFWGGALIAAYLWLVFLLTRFSYSRPWGEALGTYLASTLRTLALTAMQGVPGLFTVIIIVVAARGASRLVASFFDAVESGAVDIPWIHPETANPTKRIAIALLWLFAVIVAYPYLPGSGSDVFRGVTVFAGLVLSLGSSGVVSQAMSGLVLMYSRALKPGDFVRIGEVEGTVTVLGTLSTKIRTNKREEITIPNSVVVNTNVKNYSRLSGDAGVILYTSVTIGYDTPWRQVDALLVLAASRTPGLRSEPPPFVLKTALSDFYVEYQLNAHLDTPRHRNRVLSLLHAQIVDAFNEYGVQILSPHYEGDPDQPAIVPKERWHAPPAAPAAESPRPPRLSDGP